MLHYDVNIRVYYIYRKPLTVVGGSTPFVTTVGPTGTPTATPAGTTETLKKKIKKLILEQFVLEKKNFGYR